MTLGYFIGFYLFALFVFLSNSRDNICGEDVRGAEGM